MGGGCNQLVGWGGVRGPEPWALHATEIELEHQTSRLDSRGGGFSWVFQHSSSLLVPAGPQTMFGFQLVSQCLGHPPRPLGLAAGVGHDLPDACKVLNELALLTEQKLPSAVVCPHVGCLDTLTWCHLCTSQLPHNASQPTAASCSCRVYMS